MARRRRAGHADRVVFRRIATLPLTATPWKDLTYVTLGQASGIFGLTWLCVGPITSLAMPLRPKP